MSSTADTIDRPSSLGSLLEVRALAEAVSCFATTPLLKTLAPKGDGHPVLTLPAFLSDDGFMSPMRRFLTSLGYETNGWNRGWNTNLDEVKFRELANRVERIADRSGQKLSLIGHSLGGIYARLLAHEVPDAIRQVIYLGSPFNIDDEASTGLLIRRLYETVNPPDMRGRELIERCVNHSATPMPSTAIYSEGDGVVPWRFCLDEEDDTTENLRVPGSHTGMPFNLLILYAIADRLAQPEGNWKPFKADGVMRFFYGSSSNTP